AGEHRRLVHPGSVRGDHALGPELFQGRERVVESLDVEVIGVVHERDVDAVETESLQAGFQRPAYPVAAVVPDPDEVGWDIEALVVARTRRVRHRPQQATDLGGDQKLIPRTAAQAETEPALSE